MKRLIKKNQKIAKGMPSAVVLSIIIHAALFLLAGMLVVFTVVKKEEKKFIPPKAVERPKMKLRKPKVKVKKTSKPKPTTRIVTKVNRASMPDIQLPEMSGMGVGLEGGLGGFNVMPDFGDVSVFGRGQSIGNDFEGQFYSFVHTRAGGLAIMDEDQFLLLVRKFCTSGWRESLLSRYYRAPDKLFTTSFMVPPVPAPMAPDVFGQPEMESYWFFAKYKGQLVYPEDIRFRFWGVGDAYIVVYVDGKNVLVNGVLNRLLVLDFWQSTDADNDKYFLSDKKMRVGDWIELKAGEPVDMQVLFGEWRGGVVSGMLLVEVDGVDYPQSRQGGPLLPAFKTEEFSQDQIEQIRKYLPVGEASLTNGPVFRDFAVAGGTQAESAVVNTPDPEPKMTVEKNETRIWTLTSGKTIKAEFLTLIGGKVSLKNAKGRQITVPEGKFSEDDLNHIDLLMPPDLTLDFSKKSKQRSFPDTFSRDIPSAFYFDFKARISQSSSRLYSHELTAELFVIAQEIDGDKRILLDYQKEPFYMPDGRRSVFQIKSKTVQLSDYVIREFHRGENYKGHLIVVTDSRGEIIAYKTTSKSLFKNLDNLRKVPIGKYFDDECIRCQPTRQKRFY